MRFSGYWVSVVKGNALFERTTFDDTELDPETNWKQAWQNQEAESQHKGYLDLDAALISAALYLAKAAGVTLTQADLEQAIRFDPVWQNDRCEIQSLAELMGENAS
jgi:hypothetical protein